MGRGRTWRAATDRRCAKCLIATTSDASTRVKVTELEGDGWNSDPDSSSLATAAARTQPGIRNARLPHLRIKCKWRGRSNGPDGVIVDRSASICASRLGLAHATRALKQAGRPAFQRKAAGEGHGQAVRIRLSAARRLGQRCGAEAQARRRYRSPRARRRHRARLAWRLGGWAAGRLRWPMPRHCRLEERPAARSLRTACCSWPDRERRTRTKHDSDLWQSRMHRCAAWQKQSLARNTTQPWPSQSSVVDSSSIAQHVTKSRPASGLTARSLATLLSGHGSDTRKPWEDRPETETRT